MNMAVAKRMQLIKMIEKMEKQPNYCKKLAIKNTSHFKKIERKQGE